MTKELLRATEWKEISLTFNKNIVIKDNLPENIDKIVESEFYDGEERILASF